MYQGYMFSQPMIAYNRICTVQPAVRGFMVKKGQIVHLGYHRTKTSEKFAYMMADNKGCQRQYKLNQKLNHSLGHL